MGGDPPDTSPSSVVMGKLAVYLFPVWGLLP